MAKKIVNQRLELDLTFAREGIDQDPINPLARALDRVFREGKPLQKVGAVMVDLPADGALSPFWFGTFLYSAGDRLIFFPGYSKRLGRILTYKGKEQIRDTYTVIDHLTLEKDRDTWHMTTPLSADHFKGATSLPLTGDTVLWFGMSIASRSSLHPVRRKTIIEHQVPASDARRRHENIMRSFRDVENLKLELVPESLDPQGEHFHHFTVIVGNPEMLHAPPEEFAFPYGSPFVEPPLPHDLLIRSSAQIFELPGHCAIQITATRLPGRLTLPMHYTGQTKPQAALSEMKILLSPGISSETDRPK